MVPRAMSRGGCSAVLGAALLGAGCARTAGTDRGPGGPMAGAESAGATVGYAVNLDFEAGLTGKGRPEGWSGGGDGYERTVDADGAHGGKYGARTRRLADPPPGAPDFASWLQCIEPDHFRGKRVRYRGWLRTADVAGAGAALWMRVDGPDHRTLAFDNMDGRRARGTTGWTRYEVVLDVPTEAQRICFGWLLAGPGTAWADDLKFEFVDASTPVTDTLPK